jgi:hypothetical protein
MAFLLLSFGQSEVDFLHQNFLGFSFGFVFLKQSLNRLFILGFRDVLNDKIGLALSVGGLLVVCLLTGACPRALRGLFVRDLEVCYRELLTPEDF